MADLIQPLKKLKLESFNNLTKTLSFNIYDICYAQSETAQKEYIAYIDEAYNAERLTQILSEVAQITRRLAQGTVPTTEALAELAGRLRAIA